MMHRLILAAIIFLAGIAPAAAQDLPPDLPPVDDQAAVINPCPKEQVETADEMANHLSDWAKVDMMFKKYGACDVGELAESNSDAIAKLLTNNWQTLPQLAALMQSDPPLQPFVLHHIDRTISSEDLQKIQDLSANSCPAGTNQLCETVNDAAAQAEE